ncbi:alpha/beta fold hydrolase [Haloferax larsenii]|uniref:Pimeloyl-ACP methyl ester carboxylesterase n=1 Tax=Haloferax larsenii TaxID=302484 RepID=A0A1H7FQ63_HALLR|nr:alpha/beta hydrolase [Haloferax larsenii]SEK25515.1 Pimeloyl-ACP methyl ester carboxylesterase [Haloferax larsenii]
MHTVTSADGTTIAYERGGDGPPLVLVHGTAGDHTSWDVIRPALEAHVTVYALDRRGRGESGDANEYSLEREAEDVAAVVDSLDEPATLLGHSFGGLCALEAAVRTDNLQSLVLYEPTVLRAVDGLYSAAVADDIEALLADDRNEEALLVFLREVVDGLSEDGITSLQSSAIWPERVEAAQTVLREYRTLADYEFDAAQGRGVSVPTLLLVGGESGTPDEETANRLAETLPNSRIAVLERQKHLAYYDAPDLFADEVLQFVRETR